ncbi:MAG: phosphorylase [Nitrospirota bacterium]|nr:MAG: phosphorylase [Nitrospirota bacterium]
MSFKEGTLWRSVLDASESAIRSGALLPIETEHEFTEGSGIRFYIRVIRSLSRKDRETGIENGRADGKTVSDPFLPYEEDLFVARVSADHIALLNKYNVVDNHLLIVTEDFEDQDELLTVKDFGALLKCMAEYDSLGFYNGGTEAGASQRHKHLQLVPLPLAHEGPSVPIEPLLDAVDSREGICSVEGLPFRNVFVRLDTKGDDPLGSLSEELHGLYMDMMNASGLEPVERDGRKWQPGPYCLLITREWMLLVPRSREFWGPVSINSLGFAGAFLVRDRSQLYLVKKEGPMQVLKHVAFPL